MKMIRFFRILKEETIMILKMFIDDYKDDYKHWRNRK